MGSLGPTTPVDDALRGMAALREDRIDVWVIDVRRFSPLPALLHETLTSAELERAGRFTFEADRQRFRIGRALLRQALSAACASTGASEIRLGQSATGKLHLDDPARPIAFNVSHSGDLVLLAFTVRETVGVDVERMRHGIDFASLAQICFSDREQAVVLGGDEDAATSAAVRQRFYRYWACKESWMKADGGGLGLPLRSFSMVPAAQPDWYAVESADGTQAWRTHAFETLEGYACAVTSDAGPWAIRLLHVG
jgi:4'-phosphopantetheinyl transferase